MTGSAPGRGPSVFRPAPKTPAPVYTFQPQPYPLFLAVWNGGEPVVGRIVGWDAAPNLPPDPVVVYERDGSTRRPRRVDLSPNADGPGPFWVRDSEADAARASAMYPPPTGDLRATTADSRGPTPRGSMSFEQTTPDRIDITPATTSALGHRGPVLPQQGGPQPVESPQPVSRRADPDRFTRLIDALSAAFTDAELDVIYADLGRHAQDQSPTSVLWHVVSKARPDVHQRGSSDSEILRLASQDRRDADEDPAG